MKEHTKSRRGCLRCKKRKVKCDETLPSCHRCTVRKEVCSYVAEYGFNNAPVTQPSPTQNSTLVPEVRQSDPSSYLVDLDLTHQYLTSTFCTLWGSAEGKAVWRDTVFHMALSNQTLLCGVLATAALHRIASAGLSPELETAVLQKQAEALEGLRLGVQDITSENACPVFALATLTVFWAFASRNVPESIRLLPAGPGSQQSVIDQFLQMLRQIQPLRSVTHQSQPWLRQGSLSALFCVPNEGELPAQSESTESALRELENGLHQSSKSFPRMKGEVRTFSIRYMFRVCQSPETAELLVGWPAQLSEEYIDDLKCRDHSALTILGYWAVAFHALNDRWWAMGWSEAIILEVSRIVQGPWLELMAWPRAELGI